MNRNPDLTTPNRTENRVCWLLNIKFASLHASHNTTRAYFCVYSHTLSLSLSPTCTHTKNSLDSFVFLFNFLNCRKCLTLFSLSCRINAIGGSSLYAKETNQFKVACFHTSNASNFRQPTLHLINVFLCTCVRRTVFHPLRKNTNVRYVTNFFK